MATDFKSIPIIDISAVVEKSSDASMADDSALWDVVRQLDDACKQAGFFYVVLFGFTKLKVSSTPVKKALNEKGHGIPSSLLKEVRDITRQFFHLPLEEKLKIKLSAETGYRGYQEVGDNVTKGAPDMHEAIDCYRELNHGIYGDLGKPMEGPNLWPANPQNFKSVMEQYNTLCTELSRKIMRGIALALGGSGYEMEGKVAGDPFWVMRLIGYPVVSKEDGDNKPENDIGCGAHTDYGLLTLVNQDEDITALQVRNHSGEWIWAPPIPDTFVCNIGDMLKILTNGLYESTLHRVINNSPKYRVCVAYFYETNFDAAIEPLEMCVQKTGGFKKLGRAVYGEHLVGKVTTNFRY